VLVVFVGITVTVAAAWIAGSPAAPAPSAAAGNSVPLQPGRTTSVVVTVEVGSPLERAVPGRAYGLAVIADSEQRWADAAALYREATTEWAAASRLQPSRALELAGAKAERERQRSQMLASRLRSAAGGRSGRDPAARRAESLEEARLLRAKLLATRAFLGRVPPALFAKTRDRLQEALRAGDTPDGGESPSPIGDAEINLALCSTFAAGGEVEAARLARARVATADRADHNNRLGMAACAAGLGETRAAIAELEVLVLHPGPSRTDRFQLRDLYLSNDWDRLRGDPRFESLFPR
jgi:hypothetical protein